MALSRKHYECAAHIAQEYAALAKGYHYPTLPASAVVDAFVRLFNDDGNPRFNEPRFRAACMPGNKVRVRNPSGETP